MEFIDIENDYASAEQAQADWSLVSGDPNKPTEYDTALVKAARRMVREYGRGTVDYDDLIQEGYIILATRSQAMRTAHSLGEGILVNALYQDLTDKVKATVARNNGRQSLDVYLAGRE
ncbi:hypothetical protein BI024_gp46 [Streptomyces phage Nanodon]|uniref:Uncharacterized protein n=1 Tax=Streptomyces phage Nanodon TaxID=1873777 RepID=A0A1B1PA69_9CAUD|nr:hypothetical protein BI024_gp46 [Streptomyces phage Nanodon]ANT41050.1 hypothetical protein SEA_NANODON_46 [Streptomyces phage Nanodon]